MVPSPPAGGLRRRDVESETRGALGLILTLGPLLSSLKFIVLKAHTTELIVIGKVVVERLNTDYLGLEVEIKLYLE